MYKMAYDELLEKYESLQAENKKYKKALEKIIQTTRSIVKCRPIVQSIAEQVLKGGE